MIDNARCRAQSTVVPGARGFVFNADLAMLVKFLEIGTRFERQGSLIDHGERADRGLPRAEDRLIGAGVGGRGRATIDGDRRRGRAARLRRRSTARPRPMTRSAGSGSSSSRSSGSIRRAAPSLTRAERSTRGSAVMQERWVRRRPAPFATIFEERKFHEEGSFATLLGCEVTGLGRTSGRNGTAVALGDTRAVPRPGRGWSQRFPALVRPSSGSTRTASSPSRAARDACGPRLAGRRALCEVGDRLFLATRRDRGSGWSREAARPAGCWRELGRPRAPGPRSAGWWPRERRARRDEERRRDAAAGPRSPIRDPSRLVVCR